MLQYLSKNESIETHKMFDIFCHQVSITGRNDDDLTREIFSVYPEVQKEYQKVIDNRRTCLGDNLYVRASDNRVCVSMFSKHEYGKCLHTDFGGLAMCFERIEKKLKISAPNLIVGFQYLMGEKNNTEEWDVIESMIKTLSEKAEQQICIVQPFEYYPT